MDISSFSALASTFSTLTEMVKSIFQMNKDAALDKKFIELREIIMSTQSQALSIHADYTKLAEIKNEIEKKLIAYEDWTKTESQYELKKLDMGVFVYSPNCHDETMHWLCTNCYQKRIKSILQFESFVPGGCHYFCPNCKTTLFLKKPMDHYQLKEYQ